MNATPTLWSARAPANCHGENPINHSNHSNHSNRLRENIPMKLRPHNSTVLTTIEIPDIPADIPYIVDDLSLAYSLDISNKVLWWLLVSPHQNYVRHEIPKSSGGVRVVYAPTKLMAKVQTNLLVKYLTPLQEKLGKHVVAYRQGVSIPDSVKQHIFPCDICDNKLPDSPKIQHACPRRGTHIHIDLKDFFPSTRPAWIRRFFIDIGYSHHIANLLSSLLTIRLTSLGTPGVPQGFQGSGAICNLIANQLIDRPILDYLDTVRVKYNTDTVYTRYSDDLEISLSINLSKDTTREIVGSLYDIIFKSGYRVNKTKTRIHHNYQRKVILGATVNAKVNCNRKEWMKFRAIVHNCHTTSIETQASNAGKSAEEFIPWLRGNINWILALNPIRGNYLLSLFKESLSREAKNA